ncbi:hypothetical protein EXIGLDRAFT_229157 [Exidia glandulosa HHB12029]|uniref:Uncharacterized protein n=1 Tax=Exidia glandulosa HHB12029 TaxID=1314781 RepID=A0A165E811_EXIGL|nr:hypothetical protein EXIGLDRAFT_229157 [Exidia glandulosa HHB12029]
MVAASQRWGLSLAVYSRRRRALWSPTTFNRSCYLRGGFRDGSFFNPHSGRAAAIALLHAAYRCLCLLFNMSQRFYYLRLGIVGHDSCYAYELSLFNSYPYRRGVDGLPGDGLVCLQDIVVHLDRLHRKGCTCGRTVTAANVLKVDLRTAQDIDTALEDFNTDDGARILQVISNPQALVKDLFPADAVVGPNEGVQLLFTTNLNGHPTPFTGVRRLGVRGNVCRVSGSTVRPAPVLSTATAVHL